VRKRHHHARIPRILLFAAASLLISGVLAVVPKWSVPVAAFEIAGHKDSLFALPPVLEKSADGAFQIIDYREMRDINGRDQIVERRVKRNYVDLSVRRKTRLRMFSGDGRRLEIGEAGQFEGARFAVIFIHGRNGDRRLGMDDYRFGGNFNRLKNLAVKNGGVYIAPSVRSFDDNGVADIAALIAVFKRQSVGAPVILACGSMGSIICLSLARDRTAAKMISGMVLLGGSPDEGLPASALAKARTPITFMHGSADAVYSHEAQRAVFDALRAKYPGYPTQFLLLNGGSHGSPIRMIDWKSILSDMLASH